MSSGEAVRVRMTGGEFLRARRARSRSTRERVWLRVFRPIERSVPGAGRVFRGSVRTRGMARRGATPASRRSMTPEPRGIGVEVVERGVELRGRHSGAPELFGAGCVPGRVLRPERLLPLGERSAGRAEGREVGGRFVSGRVEGREALGRELGRLLGREALGRELGRLLGREALGRELGRLLGREALGRELGRLLGREALGREL
ncbi:MAG: hypothetical protein GY711_22070 [bacterium]|nr:hypothetical protein [bacterium]